MTIFRQDFTVGFFAAFVILSFVKIFHWMIQDRVDFIETTPNVTRSQHIRIVAFICLLIGIDYVLLHYALASTLSKGVSINLLFAFEYAIQISTAVTTLCKYTLSVIDMAMEGRWEGKGVAVFYLELALDLLHLITYTAFFAAVFTTYGIPIHLVRDLYWTFRNFQTRVRDFLRYRQVAAIMEHRFPDATAEDLTRADHVCIVCREDMGPGSRAKRLDCSHSFHVHCLRSWLERQQNCPICRAPVLAAVDSARRNRAGGFGAAAGAAAGGAHNEGVGNGAAQGGAENNNNNNRPAGGAAADGGAGAGQHRHDPAGADVNYLLNLNALLGLEDEFRDFLGERNAGQGGNPPVNPAERNDADGTGLRWRGQQPQQPQQNDNAAAGGGPPMHPFMQYPMQMQQYPYGYYPPPPMPFPQQQQQWQWQQPQHQEMAATTGVTPNTTAGASTATAGSVPASPPPQQQQQQNFTTAGTGTARTTDAGTASTSTGTAQNQNQLQPPQSPMMMPSFFPIPVFIPMMTSPGPHTPIPGSHTQHQQQQQQITPEQHAMAAALAAAATSAATMSMPFMMPVSPQPSTAAGYSPMPMYSQQPGFSGNSEASSSTVNTQPIVNEQQGEAQVAVAAPPPPPQGVVSNEPAPPLPVPTTSTNSSTPTATVVNNGDDEDEAAQIRRRRLERFQNGVGGSPANL